MTKWNGEEGAGVPFCIETIHCIASWFAEHKGRKGHNHSPTLATRCLGTKRNHQSSLMPREVRSYPIMIPRGNWAVSHCLVWKLVDSRHPSVRTVSPVETLETSSMPLLLVLLASSSSFRIYNLFEIGEDFLAQKLMWSELWERLEKGEDLARFLYFGGGCELALPMGKGF